MVCRLRILLPRYSVVIIDLIFMVADFATLLLVCIITYESIELNPPQNRRMLVLIQAMSEEGLSISAGFCGPGDICH